MTSNVETSERVLWSALNLLNFNYIIFLIARMIESTMYFNVIIIVIFINIVVFLLHIVIKSVHEQDVRVDDNGEKWIVAHTYRWSMLNPNKQTIQMAYNISKYFLILLLTTTTTIQPTSKSESKHKAQVVPYESFYVLCNVT